MHVLLRLILSSLILWILIELGSRVIRLGKYYSRCNQFQDRDIVTYYQCRFNLFQNQYNNKIKPHSTDLWSILTACLGKLPKKKPVFFWEISPKSVYPPTHPRFLWDLGERKVKFGSTMAIFGVIWGGFEGFGPCLRISHPTHPHLGEISQKKTVFFLAASLSKTYLFSETKFLIFFV